MLVEIESLVAPTTLSVPRRVASGVDAGRVNMLCAVLTRRVGLNLGGQDVYVNVSGGVRIEERRPTSGWRSPLPRRCGINLLGLGPRVSGRLALPGTCVTCRELRGGRVNCSKWASGV